jgi:hypothetical protein
MHCKILIALACAVIGAPAFAQSGDDFLQFAQLTPCPHQLTYHQTPCSNLEFNSSPPPDLSIHSEPNGWTGPDYRWAQRLPERPSSNIQLPSGPVVHGGMSGGTIGGYEWKR